MPRSAKCSVGRNSLFWVFISKITCHQRPMFLGKKCRILDAHASQSRKRQQNIGWKIPLIAGHKHLTSPPLEIQNLPPNLTKVMIFQLHRLLLLQVASVFFVAASRLHIKSKLLINESKHSKTSPGFSPKKNFYNYTHP